MVRISTKFLHLSEIDFPTYPKLSQPIFQGPGNPKKLLKLNVAKIEIIDLPRNQSVVFYGLIGNFKALSSLFKPKIGVNQRVRWFRREVKSEAFFGSSAPFPPRLRRFGSCLAL